MSTDYSAMPNDEFFLLTANPKWRSAGGLLIDPPSDWLEEWGKRQKPHCRHRSVQITRPPRTRTRSLANQPEEPTHYFIQADLGGPIKIGVTRHFHERFKSLQRMCPFSLHVLATVNGTEEDEKLLHERFAAFRSHGEWFHPDQEILSYIEGLEHV